MSSKYVRDQAKAHLVAWGVLPVKDYSNLGGDLPDPPDYFVTIRFPGAVEDQGSTGAPGDNLWREIGVFNVIVYAPSGVGDDQLLDYVEQLRVYFRGKKLGEVQCQEADPPDTTFPSSVNASLGNFIGYGTMISYMYDVTGF